MLIENEENYHEIYRSSGKKNQEYEDEMGNYPKKSSLTVVNPEERRRIESFELQNENNRVFETELIRKGPDFQMRGRDEFKYESTLPYKKPDTRSVAIQAAIENNPETVFHQGSFRVSNLKEFSDTGRFEDNRTQPIENTRTKENYSSLREHNQPYYSQMPVVHRLDEKQDLMQETGKFASEEIQLRMEERSEIRQPREMDKKAAIGNDDSKEKLTEFGSIQNSENRAHDVTSVPQTQISQEYSQPIDVEKPKNLNELKESNPEIINEEMKTSIDKSVTPEGLAERTVQTIQQVPDSADSENVEASTRLASQTQQPRRSSTTSAKEDEEEVKEPLNTTMDTKSVRKITEVSEFAPPKSENREIPSSSNIDINEAFKYESETNYSMTQPEEVVFNKESVKSEQNPNQLLTPNEYQTESALISKENCVRKDSAAAMESKEKLASSSQNNPIQYEEVIVSKEMTLETKGDKNYLNPAPEQIADQYQSETGSISQANTARTDLMREIDTSEKLASSIYYIANQQKEILQNPKSSTLRQEFIDTEARVFIGEERYEEYHYLAGKSNVLSSNLKREHSPPRSDNFGIFSPEIKSARSGYDQYNPSTADVSRTAEKHTLQPFSQHNYYKDHFNSNQHQVAREEYSETFTSPSIKRTTQKGHQNEASPVLNERAYLQSKSVERNLENELIRGDPKFLTISSEFSDKISNNMDPKYQKSGFLEQTNEEGDSADEERETTKKKRTKRTKKKKQQDEKEELVPVEALIRNPPTIIKEEKVTKDRKKSMRLKRYSKLDKSQVDSETSQRLDTIESKDIKRRSTRKSLNPLNISNMSNLEKEIHRKSRISILIDPEKAEKDRKKSLKRRSTLRKKAAEEPLSENQEIHNLKRGSISKLSNIEIEYVPRDSDSDDGRIREDNSEYFGPTNSIDKSNRSNSPEIVVRKPLRNKLLKSGQAEIIPDDPPTWKFFSVSGYLLPAAQRLAREKVSIAADEVKKVKEGEPTERYYEQYDSIRSEAENKQVVEIYEDNEVLRLLECVQPESAIIKERRGHFAKIEWPPKSEEVIVEDSEEINEEDQHDMIEEDAGQETVSNEEIIDSETSIMDEGRIEKQEEASRIEEPENVENTVISVEEDNREEDVRQVDTGEIETEEIHEGYHWLEEQQKQEVAPESDVEENKIESDHKEVEEGLIQREEETNTHAVDAGNLSSEKLENIETRETEQIQKLGSTEEITSEKPTTTTITKDSRRGKKVRNAAIGIDRDEINMMRKLENDVIFNILAMFYHPQSLYRPLGKSRDSSG